MSSTHGDPDYLYLCRAGHAFYNETPWNRAGAERKVPQGCPCGERLLGKYAHYDSFNPNESFRGEYPLSFEGIQSFTRRVRITNAVDRKGNPIEAYEPKTWQFPTWRVIWALIEEAREKERERVAKEQAS